MSMKPSFNMNAARNNNFLLQFDRIPGVSFMCNSVNVPGISINHAPIPIPTHNPTFRPGDILQYNPLSIRFQINEDFENYIELQKWMRQITPSEGWEETMKVEDAYSNCVVSITDNAQVPIAAFYFNWVLPASIGDIDFSTTSPDDEVLTVDASFVYSSYTMELRGRKII